MTTDPNKIYTDIDEAEEKKRAAEGGGLEGHGRQGRQRLAHLGQAVGAAQAAAGSSRQGAAAVLQMPEGAGGQLDPHLAERGPAERVRQEHPASHR